MGDRFCKSGPPAGRKCERGGRTPPRTPPGHSRTPQDTPGYPQDTPGYPRLPAPSRAGLSPSSLPGAGQALDTRRGIKEANGRDPTQHVMEVRLGKMGGTQWDTWRWRGARERPDTPSRTQGEAGSTGPPKGKGVSTLGGSQGAPWSLQATRDHVGPDCFPWAYPPRRPSPRACEGAAPGAQMAGSWRRRLLWARRDRRRLGEPRRGGCAL